MNFDWIKWGGIAAIAVGIVLALAGLHHHIYQQGYTAGAAAVQQKFDAAKEAAEAKRLADVQAARAEEQRRTQAQAEIANDATKQAAAAAADAVAAGAAADGLRARVARLIAAARAASHPTVAGASPGQPGGDPLDVLIDVLSRTDGAAGQLGDYADRLRVAGLACERSYDALTLAKH
ncbi:DUF2514 family protein [Ralstonia insidiosa]|uniref:DUF2514 family protein n=1 Tax=Ralstonia insidiosa TaxID=190721 RepID=A0A848NP43_9RALS|nr:DUF2514 family protein [Ralstonia insidiosa]NMV36912.1 DUF2514 family protein [Ralstonia insidiosa]